MIPAVASLFALPLFRTPRYGPVRGCLCRYDVLMVWCRDGSMVRGCDIKRARKMKEFRYFLGLSSAGAISFAEADDDAKDGKRRKIVEE